MAPKRNSKQPVNVSLLRRSKRLQNPKISPFHKYKFIPRKKSRKETNISCLPEDVLLQIFSYFNKTELFYNLCPVCRRWRNLAMDPSSWKEIDVGPNVPTETLLYWIASSPLLSSFCMRRRNDANVIIEALSKNCKHLESVKIQSCGGSPKNYLINSAPLCNLVTRCQKLCNFNFNQCRITSKKFFRIISKNKNNGKIMRKCNYVGPMSVGQMRALVLALKDFEIQDSATIRNINSSQKFRLKDIVVEEVENPSEIDPAVTKFFIFGEKVVECP